MEYIIECFESDTKSFNYTIRDKVEWLERNQECAEPFDGEEEYKKAYKFLLEKYTKLLEAGNV